MQPAPAYCSQLVHSGSCQYVTPYPPSSRTRWDIRQRMVYSYLMGLGVGHLWTDTLSAILNRFQSFFLRSIEHVSFVYALTQNDINTFSHHQYTRDKSSICRRPYSEYLSQLGHHHWHVTALRNGLLSIHTIRGWYVLVILQNSAQYHQRLRTTG